MDSWRYEPALDLEQSLVQRLRQFPREPDMLWYGLRSLAAVSIRAWLRTYHRLTIRGAENLPAGGSFVMVSNHTSHLDALCLLSTLPLNRLHRAFPAAAADYFFTSIPRVAVAVLAINALPFHREIHVRQSIQVCRHLLANSGNVLIIFPEGTRSSSGRLGSFRSGIAMLVAGTPVPVVPCYLHGTHAALPKGTWLPRPRRIDCVIGTPRSYESFGADKDSLRQVCQDLRNAVGELAPAAGVLSDSPCAAQPFEPGVQNKT